MKKRALLICFATVALQLLTACDRNPERHGRVDEPVKTQQASDQDKASKSTAK